MFSRLIRQRLRKQNSRQHNFGAAPIGILIVPPDADVAAVADAIVNVVNAPYGRRPFRVHVDPTDDGAAVTFAVMDLVRAEMLHRVGLSDLLEPRPR